MYVVRKGQSRESLSASRNFSLNRCPDLYMPMLPPHPTIRVLSQPPTPPQQQLEAQQVLSDLCPERTVSWPDPGRFLTSCTTGPWVPSVTANRPACTSLGSIQAQVCSTLLLRLPQGSLLVLTVHQASLARPHLPLSDPVGDTPGQVWRVRVVRSHRVWQAGTEPQSRCF